MTTPFFIKMLHPLSRVPTKAHTDDAGYDVYSVEEKTIKAGSFDVISTGIAFLQDSIPPGYYCRIASRSGLACKSGINVGAGVVDRGYTGEIKVCLFNHSSVDFCVKVGDKIAQLIFTAILNDLCFITTSESEVMTVEKQFESSDQRGTAGFGSTDQQTHLCDLVS